MDGDVKESHGGVLCERELEEEEVVADAAGLGTGSELLLS